MKTLSIIILSALLLISCDPNNQKLRLKNDTNDTLYYRVLYDTLIYQGLHLYKCLPYEEVMPNLVMGRGDGVWEYRINHESADSSLHVFIFKDSLITENTLIEKGYIEKGFSVNMLVERNWLIRYPSDFGINVFK